MNPPKSSPLKFFYSFHFCFPSFLSKHSLPLPSKLANKVLTYESVWFNGGEKRDFNGWRGGILNCFMFDSKRGWEDF
jgi:hypothetical protein